MRRLKSKSLINSEATAEAEPRMFGVSLLQRGLYFSEAKHFFRDFCWGLKLCTVSRSGEAPLDLLNWREAWCFGVLRLDSRL